MRRWIFVLCVVLYPLQAWAAGYGVYEWSARGNALGGAMVARDGDPSSVAYNPACITDVPGKQIQIGATAIAPSATMDVKSDAVEDMDFADSVWALPTMYYTHQLSDNYWFGLGMFSRVGLGTEYEDADTWAGRYNCSRAAIKSVSINPNMALRFSDAFSLAVGVEATYLDFGYDMTFKAPGVPNSDYLHEISADGWGYGMNLGARYKPFDWLAFGLMWRSEIQLTVHGDGDFTQKGTVPLSFKSTDVTGTEPIPESVTMGVMVKPMERLSLEFDAVWTRWSSYKSLIVNYDDPQPGFGDKLESTKNWHNTWRFQFGAEYALTDSIDLRAGYVYDQSPVNDDYEDYAVPCTDRQIVTLGTGWKINEAWAVDASYGYLWMKDRDYEARPKAGILELTREDASAHMAGLSVTYKF
ncbi:OmpP1/FadL family transporter [Desulfomicrobium baculatum]|uniref:Membrane protein involved in aromatic hydrocarbon degradation n=1 Tax=Desulfomicrobium baculatum (strain DSM 4028 / VKM B-1378 / X) TaxID=525897 RepID=C7LNB2_DESBD|nr:OmpP1/FadL family transporter [Desulfomicrobium baculatum]ACU90081.1 membrane protein involved in aromatic hydrocarbon degradation [Desulfomicrobium baculatum DSM 4028]